MALPNPNPGQETSLRDMISQQSQIVDLSRFGMAANSSDVELDDRVIELTASVEIQTRSVVDSLNQLNDSVLEGNNLLNKIIQVDLQQLQEQRKAAFREKEAALEASRKQLPMAMSVPSGAATTAANDSGGGLLGRIGNLLSFGAAGAAGGGLAGAKEKSPAKAGAGLAGAKQKSPAKVAQAQAQPRDAGGRFVKSPAAPSATPKASLGSKVLGGLGKGAKALKGVPGLSLIAPLVEAGAIAASSEMTEEEKTKEYFGVGGGLGGAATGAVAGAAIGSVVPFVGTAIGGVLGGIAGGFLGEAAVESAYTAITGDDSDEGKEAAKEAAGAKEADKQIEAAVGDPLALPETEAESPAAEPKTDSGGFFSGLKSFFGMREEGPSQREQLDKAIETEQNLQMKQTELLQLRDSGQLTAEGQKSLEQTSARLSEATAKRKELESAVIGPEPISYQQAASMSPEELKEKGYIDFADQDDKNDFLNELQMESGVAATAEVRAQPIPRETGATVTEATAGAQAAQQTPVNIVAPKDQSTTVNNNTVVQPSKNQVQPRNTEPSFNSAQHSGFPVTP